MPCAYKDFNKKVKDCLDTGSSVEQKMKFSTKSRDGTKFEATQTRRVEDSGRDKAGQFSNFCIKFAKGKGFNLDEFSVDQSNSATSKWSMGGVVPDGKLKAKVSHDLSNVVPTKVDLSVDYGKGDLKASAGIKRKVVGASGMDYSADAVYAAGDFTLGAALTGTQGAKAKMDYNLAAAYAMGDTSIVLQTAKKLSVLNLHVHNKCSNRFMVASSTKAASGSSVAQTVGCQYQIDADSRCNVKLGLGNLAAFDVNAVTIDALYSAKVRSYATVNASATLALGATDRPKFGWNVEFA
jgi:hypothetical protein